MRFFDKPAYKRFNIQPRYWDPDKEEREERERRARAELGLKDDDGTYIPNIKGRMKSELRHKHSETRQLRRKSNLSFILILAVLLILAYIYLYGWDGIL